MMVQNWEFSFLKDGLLRGRLRLPIFGMFLLASRWIDYDKEPSLGLDFETRIKSIDILLHLDGDSKGFKLLVGQVHESDSGETRK
jgi:hypothetical protein